MNQPAPQGPIEAPSASVGLQVVAPEDVGLPYPRSEANVADEQQLSRSQQAVVDSVASLFLDLATEGKSEPITSSAIAQRSGLPPDEAGSILEELVQQKHLAKKPIAKDSEAEGFEPTPSGANLLATQSRLRQELLDAGAVILPEQVMVRFEQNRNLLLGVARRVLAKANLAGVWAEDVVSEAAFYTCRRFTSREFPPVGAHKLLGLFVAVVQSRAIDFIRKELQICRASGTKFHTSSYEAPQFLNATGESVLDQLRERDPLFISTGEQGVQNAYSSDELLTILARLFLAMKPDQRDAIFREYFKSSGAQAPSTVKNGTQKSRLHYGRKKALEEAAAKLLPGYVASKDASSREIMAEVGELLLGDRDDIQPGNTALQDSDEEVKAMRRHIRNMLYPESASR